MHFELQGLPLQTSNHGNTSSTLKKRRPEEAWWISPGPGMGFFTSFPLLLFTPFNCPVHSPFLDSFLNLIFQKSFCKTGACQNVSPMRAGICSLPCLLYLEPCEAHSGCSVC